MKKRTPDREQSGLKTVLDEYQNSYMYMNERPVDDISLEFFYKPHTLTLLAVSIFAVMYFAFVRSSEQCQITIHSSSIMEIYANISDFETGSSEKEEDFVDYIIMSLSIPEKYDKAIKKFDKLYNPKRFIKRIVRETLENPQNIDQLFEFSLNLQDITTKYITAWVIADHIFINKSYNCVEYVMKLLQSILNSDDYANLSDFDQKNIRIMISRTKREIEMENRLEITKMLFTLQLLNLDLYKNFNEILKIGQKARLYEKKLLVENEIDFNDLEVQFPEIVLLLLWEQCVTIKSNNANEFIYAHKDTLDSGEKLYTQRTKEKNNDEFKWIFEQDQNDSTHFYLQNMGTNEYLYASKTKIQHNEERKLKMSAHKLNMDSYKWFLEPKDQSAILFSIVNVAFNERIVVYQQNRIFASTNSYYDQLIISEC